MRALGHIGLSVPDLDAAVTWYGDVMGFDPIMSAHDIRLAEAPEENNFVAMCHEIFGARFRHVRVAHLATANGTALELFQFVDPPHAAPDENFAYWRGGLFHLCVVAPDIEEQVARIVATGGRQRSRIRSSFPGRPYKACYCEDPWGTVVEVVTHSHERMLSNHD